MKKILLATTLLAATAGVAAAEVAVTATARMGIISSTNLLGVSTDPMFTSRVRIIFTATGETDGGLSFGASVRNDQAGTGNTANGDSTVFISGAFGKLTMGDTGNAADALVGQVSGVGLTGLGDLNEIAWVGKTTTGALYEYSAGALTFALGVGQVNVGDDFMSAAVKYSTDAYGVALGYEDNSTTGTTQISLLGSATFSGATIKAKITDVNYLADMEYALSADYAMNGVNLTAFYASAENTVAGHINNGLVTTRYGIGASYDLGGGASVVGGVAREENTDTVFDLGVSMSF